jgi:hypothetical protein
MADMSGRGRLESGRLDIRGVAGNDAAGCCCGVCWVCICVLKPKILDAGVKLGAASKKSVWVWVGEGW